MKMIKEIILVIFALIFIPNISYSASSQNNQTNIYVHGSILNAPCKVRNKIINVEFGDIIGKYLYIHDRTRSIPFSIELDDCKTNIANSVIVTFTGRSSSGEGLDGFLALDSSSVATGVGIGIETDNGKFLPLNQSTKAMNLISGYNALAFKAFVKGDDRVLRNKSLGFGEFLATATFVLEYP
ncbi:TPA: type 1 fimbrial protein [Proteus mirabilis]|nr:type 1 fimbrial protein [Proteus mirabilis]